jgi:hypothetical protein
LSEVIVYKLDEKGREVWRYPASVLERRAHSIRLQAYFNRDDLDLGFTVFKRGDRFIETFYNDRWYNVFAVYDGESKELKGWYCNVCRPAEWGDASVRCEDLALDMWVAPGAEPKILDEEEFYSLPISSQERQQCLQALQQLQQLALGNRLPS